MKRPQGFSIVELFIIVAVIAIIIAIALTVINPAKQMRESRDTKRVEAVNTLLDAFLQATVAQKGKYPAGIKADGSVQMIAQDNGTCAVRGCPTAVTQCVDLDELVTGDYLTALPKDPSGTKNYGGTLGGTGYTISVATNEVVTITACGAETFPIEAAR